MYSKIIEEDCLEILQDSRLLNMIKGKSFLITGSNGLIGNYFTHLFHIANEYFDADIMAYCYSKHEPSWATLKFEYHTGDLTDHGPFWLDCPDYIIHGATYPRPRIFLQNELETIALNVNVLQRLLGLERKLLFLSSSEVYGQPPLEDLPTDENYTRTFQTDNVRSAYVESKRMGETLCHIYNRNYNMENKIVRLSLIYGPGISIKDERAMGDFLRMALVDKHIKLLDKGEAMRTYCYVTDAIKMMLHILLEGKETVYNVGGVETRGVYDVAQMIRVKCGVGLERGYQEMPDAPSYVKMDIDRVCNEFKVDDFVPLDEGLDKTIAWNKEQKFV